MASNEGPAKKNDLIRAIYYDPAGEFEHIRGASRSVYLWCIYSAWMVEAQPKKGNYPGCVMGNITSINAIARGCAINWGTAADSLEQLEDMEEVTLLWRIKAKKPRIAVIQIERLPVVKMFDKDQLGSSELTNGLVRTVELD